MELKLSPKERRSLEAVVAAPVDAQQLKRAQGLLAVAEGERPTAIARRLQVSRESIYNWVTRWTERDEPPAERLCDRPRSGRPPTLRDQVATEVSGLLQSKPVDHGYRQAEWTTALLQGHLAARQIVASRQTIQAQLHQLGYRWKRPRFVLRRRSPTWKQAKGG
jgi:transposase